MLKRILCQSEQITVIQLDLIKPEINLFMDSKVPSTSIDNNIKQAARYAVIKLIKYEK